MLTTTAGGSRTRSTNGAHDLPRAKTAPAPSSPARAHLILLGWHCRPQ